MEFTKESQCYQYNKISGYLHALVTQPHHKKSKKMTDIPESPNRSYILKIFVELDK